MPGFSTVNAGLVSSVAMSSVQGIQLINPDLIKQKASNNSFENYFSEKKGFQTVLNERNKK